MIDFITNKSVFTGENVILNITENATSSTFLRNDSTFYWQTIEELEWKNFLSKNFPIAVFLTILSVVGTIGNFQSLIVYSRCYKESNHRTFIICLSAVDLIACMFSIPFEIIDARYSFTFYDTVSCKFFRYLSHFVSLCSGFLLGVIAVDRYRKVCKNNLRQLTLSQASLTCVITTVTTLLISIPSLIFYGPTPKLLENGLVGSDCRLLTKYKKSAVFRGFNYALLFLSTVVFILCVVAYSFIGKVIYRQVKFNKARKTFGGQDGISVSNVKTDTEDLSSVGHNISVATPNPANNNAKPTKIRRKTRLDRSKQIALMLLVASAISYVGYLPHLILVIIKGIRRKWYNKISESLGPVAQLFIRGYYMTHVTNPIVYCFLDDHFKRECRKMYSKLKNKLFN